MLHKVQFWQLRGNKVSKPWVFLRWKSENDDRTCTIFSSLIFARIVSGTREKPVWKKIAVVEFFLAEEAKLIGKVTLSWKKVRKSWARLFFSQFISLQNVSWTRKMQFSQCCQKNNINSRFFCPNFGIDQKNYNFVKKTVFLPNVPQETEKAPLTLLLLSFPWR